MRIGTVQRLLCENFPHLLSDFVVKREVKNGCVVLHIDWQGVFQQKFFQLIIFNLTDDKEDNK